MTDLIEGTLEKARAAIATHDLVAPDAAVLLMVSGGSDSTALAYLGAALREAGDVGPVAMLHVNHQLRGEDADADFLQSTIGLVWRTLVLGLLVVTLLWLGSLVGG